MLSQLAVVELFLIYHPSFYLVLVILQGRISLGEGERNELLNRKASRTAQNPLPHDCLKGPPQPNHDASTPRFHNYPGVIRTIESQKGIIDKRTNKVS